MSSLVRLGRDEFFEFGHLSQRFQVFLVFQVVNEIGVDFDGSLERGERRRLSREPGERAGAMVMSG